MGHEFSRIILRKQVSPRAHQHDPLEVLTWVKALRMSLNGTPQLAQLPERSLILRLEQCQNVQNGMYGAVHVTCGRTQIEKAYGRKRQTKEGVLRRGPYQSWAWMLCARPENGWRSRRSLAAN